MMLNIEPAKTLKIEELIFRYQSQYPAICKKIGLYLNKRYNIDAEYNSLAQQITCYAHKNKLMWLDGLFDLLDTLQKDLEVLENIDAVILSEDIIRQEPSGIFPIERVVLSNGSIISVEDIIELSDKIDNDFEKTKFFDAYQPCPEWGIFSYSEKDFQFVQFYFEGKEIMETYFPSFSFGRVTRIFSNTISKINSISIVEGKVVVFTSLYRIEIEDALASNEVILKGIRQDDTNLYDFSSLIETVEIFLLGLIPDPLSKIVKDWSIEHLPQKKKWFNYSKSIMGYWYKVGDASVIVPTVR